MAAEPAQPLWRRIADFPLVTLLIVLLAVWLPIFLTGRLLALTAGPVLPEDAYFALRGVVGAGIGIAAYRFITARVGEDRADHMPLDRRTIDGPRGLLIGFLLMTAIVALAWLAGGYRITGWGGGTSFANLFFMAGLSAGVIEEIFARGILFRYFEQLGGSWFALALSAGLFGFAHWSNEHATLLSTLAIALEAGILLGGAYMLTRNLWLAVGLHFGWNFTQGFIWDVPVSGHDVDGLVHAQPAGSELVSGGAFGLEGSLIALVLATGLGVWYVTRAVRAGNVIRPWWVQRDRTGAAGE